MQLPLVRPERTQWRDQKISERHRIYGWDCPAVDVDFLMVEYDRARPVAIVEYKAFGARNPDLRHPTYCAIRVLADAAGIPFLVAFYNAATWQYHVTPANRVALNYLEYKVHEMTEVQYVELLYRIRGRSVPASVLGHLNGGSR